MSNYTQDSWTGTIWSLVPLIEESSRDIQRVSPTVLWTVYFCPPSFRNSQLSGSMKILMLHVITVVQHGHNVSSQSTSSLSSFPSYFSSFSFLWVSGDSRSFIVILGARPCLGRRFDLWGGQDCCPVLLGGSCLFLLSNFTPILPLRSRSPFWECKSNRRPLSK